MLLAIGSYSPAGYIVYWDVLARDLVNFAPAASETNRKQLCAGGIGLWTIGRPRVDWEIAADQTLRSDLAWVGIHRRASWLLWKLATNVFSGTLKSRRKGQVCTVIQMAEEDLRLLQGEVVALGGPRDSVQNEVSFLSGPRPQASLGVEPDSEVCAFRLVLESFVVVGAQISQVGTNCRAE